MSQAEIIHAVREILRNADLETLSRKMVRAQLEERFGRDMTDMKGLINDKIAEIIEEQQEADEEGDEELGSAEGSEVEEESEEEEIERPTKKAKKNTSKTQPKPKKKTKRRSSAAPPTASGNRGGAFNANMSLSPELAEFLGEKELPRPQIVKRLWEYIREHDLQDPNDKREILLDKRMESVFQRKAFSMFSMNKYIKRHVRKVADLPSDGWNSVERGGESSEEDEEKKAEKERLKAEKKRKKLEPKARPASNTGLNAPLKLSEDLAAFVGASEMSRPQVVKQLWVYIKANELQNPENRKEIMCDEKLEELFGEKMVTMFSMNKYLKKHFV